MVTGQGARGGGESADNTIPSTFSDSWPAVKRVESADKLRSWQPQGQRVNVCPVLEGVGVQLGRGMLGS